jgi:DTW domain-containing protein
MSVTFEPRTVCRRCQRPQSACFCDRLASLSSRTRACFLQHPREARVAIGTARMAHLSLTNSELHQGVDFAAHPRVRALAAAEGTALLFPGDGAVDPAALSSRPPRTLIIVDGTWSQARKVVKRNPFLLSLPRIGLSPAQPSNYRIRREPAAHCVSTIEAVALVLGALEGDPERFRPLLRAFDRMVDIQLSWAARRPGPPRVRRKIERRPRTDGTVAELRARPGDVVAIYAEANAHAIGSGVAGEAELIQLVALRPGSAERFEALIAPRRPLSPSAAMHLELPETLILGGEPVAEALSRFRAFVREGDLFCGWGRYAVDLLRAEGGPERPFSDLRTAAARRLRRRPGGVEQAVRLLGRPELPAPIGDGRAGRRLAALMALLQRLVACAALLASGLAAGCGPHVDVGVPVVTTLARAGVAAKPLAVCTAMPPADPTTGVAPGGWPATVVGAGFLPQVYDVMSDSPRVVVPEVSLHGPVDLTLARALLFFRDSAAIDVLVPGMLSLGLYDVSVKNPDGTTSTLVGGLQVVSPPSLQSVAPASICTTSVQHIVLTGGVFSAAAPPAVAVASIALSAPNISVDSQTQLTLTVPANTIAAGSTTASIDLTDQNACTLQRFIAVGTTCAP